MKSKILLLCLMVLFVCFFSSNILNVSIIHQINTYKVKNKIKMKSIIHNINSIKRYDFDGKVMCNCKESDAEDWRTRICEQSCIDYCSEYSELVERECKLRCANRLCSIVFEKCDITDETEISPC